MSNIVKPKTLMGYVKKISFGNEQKMPAMPGMAISAVIKEYSIPAIKWGYNGSLIGIETKKQYLIWRDKGHCLEFKGLLNKEVVN